MLNRLLCALFSLVLIGSNLVLAQAPLQTAPERVEL
jgi:hypothetical protein